MELLFLISKRNNTLVFKGKTKLINAHKDSKSGANLRNKLLIPIL